MNLYLTNSGQALLYKAQGGQTLKFTKFELGNGDLNGRSIRELTSLISSKMTANISKLDVKDNKVVVGMAFNNKDLTEGFYLKEIGLFAEDPDTHEEVLYLYGNSGEASDYIDANTGRKIEENLDLEIYISDVENINAKLDESLIFLLKKDFDEFKNKLDEKIKSNITKVEVNEKNKKEIIFTTQDGTEIKIETQDTTYKEATKDESGLMSSADKTKLDNISPVKCVAKVLTVDEWVENEEMQNYEYTITDAEVTKKHLVEGSMDLENQAKINDGYIKSFDGSYKIYTSVAPEDDITIDISIVLTDTQKEDGIIGKINYYSKNDGGGGNKKGLYGVRRLINSSDTTWERIEGSANFIANATKNGGQVQNDFDSVFPWSDIKSCDVSSTGVVYAYIGDPTYNPKSPKRLYNDRGA